MRARLFRKHVTHDIAVDIATGRNGIEQHGIDCLQGRLQVRFDDAVKLHRLPRGQPHGPIAIDPGNLVERQPLPGRQHTTRDAYTDHEGEGLLHLFTRTLRPKIAVVL